MYDLSHYLREWISHSLLYHQTDRRTPPNTVQHRYRSQIKMKWEAIKIKIPFHLSLDGFPCRPIRANDEALIMEFFI